MGMSARVLGDKVGLSAPEMNHALKQAGLLEGKPQAWGITEEGQKFASEERKWNGVGGHERYIIDYDQRTWEPKVLEVLDLDEDKKRAAREAAAEARRQAREANAARAVSPVAAPETSVDDGPAWNDRNVKVALGVGVTLLVGFVLYKGAPRVKRWWNEKRCRPEAADS